MESKTDRILLILLFFITVTQFSSWGYQSVRYILGKIFDVGVISSPLDSIIGFAAMAASALVFTGAVLWWRRNPSAWMYFISGTTLFAAKNFLDIINRIILFGMQNTGEKTVEQINTLATGIGNELFQLAFWIFILFYFRNRIRRSG
ncbi:MAG: hypothetical protein ACQESG_07285 [Nanobdellota archaeon]